MLQFKTSSIINHPNHSMKYEPRGYGLQGLEDGKGNRQGKERNLAMVSTTGAQSCRTFFQSMSEKQP